MTKDKKKIIANLKYQNAQMHLFRTSTARTTRKEKERALEEYCRASDEYHRRIRR